MNAFIDSDTLGDLKPLNRVVFSLGSNQGDSLDILQGAVDMLAATPQLIMVDVAPVYRTKPVGNTNQPDFYNTVVLAESTMEPRDLLDRANVIEQAYARHRDPDNPHGPRTLDVDLIVVGKRTSATQRLELPHPRAHERAFVLVPWLDIDPKATLPQGPIADLVARMDVGGVHKLDAGLLKP
ncbi:2-amino-4-hydroxy-6-hydroxymethyldihydropteridine diphosphokinase [Propionibacterium freudenreichii]|uniref:2-amino-4-hydroxy-6- hydroxymethyldihydropteridine diphosphokinase n=1 Tax=Propionibacterium freudenreichii TaxID=1744 RepID=UPI0005A5C82A|nr:2-amino-4-hydroxy-6-hydroxymethyldihydropteridine diphosphokinase [Propionibacterium freudenreichii]MDK9349276.1 2-amino-4-hydroxy-6-hydroxymethyldihydropteridine diphosphokinase [Propionibacterium freudenreichii]MDK9628191.1 2-amino-4-hydroxy-6-hydroxymethyldihydropteridine diphosphokinase [Propionibacterium freudenreichii]MDK9653225.1 2-amino-4-hydroxy-6-hydroxymethyldihydropteridine diphosphokinase [Propionibacterium freudenreichii]CEI33382.1 Putative hydroxymethyldihydropteridine pyropho